MKGANIADRAETAKRTWPYVIYPRKVRGGFSIRDEDGGMRMPEERTERFGGERSRWEVDEGISSDGLATYILSDRRGEATMVAGRLSIDCTIVDDGAAGRRAVINPESRCMVISDGLVRHHGKYADLFGEVVVETKSWGTERAPESGWGVGESGQ